MAMARACEMKDPVRVALVALPGTIPRTPTEPTSPNQVVELEDGHRCYAYDIGGPFSCWEQRQDLGAQNN